MAVRAGRNRRGGQFRRTAAFREKSQLLRSPRNSFSGKSERSSLPYRQDSGSNDWKRKNGRNCRFGKIESRIDLSSYRCRRVFRHSYNDGWIRLAPPLRCSGIEDSVFAVGESARVIWRIAKKGPITQLEPRPPTLLPCGMSNKLPPCVRKDCAPPSGVFSPPLRGGSCWSVGLASFAPRSLEVPERRHEYKFSGASKSGRKSFGNPAQRRRAASGIYAAEYFPANMPRRDLMRMDRCLAFRARG